MPPFYLSSLSSVHPTYFLTPEFDVAICSLHRRRSTRQAAAEGLQAEIDGLMEQLVESQELVELLTTERDTAEDELERTQDNLQKAAMFGQQLVQERDKLRDELEASKAALEEAALDDRATPDRPRSSFSAQTVESLRQETFSLKSKNEKLEATIRM